jgi:PhnB protein
MKNSFVEPYLFFNGRCEEALEFYRSAVGATIDFKMRYDETPEPMPPGSVPPGFEKKICHSTFTIGETQLMASDSCELGVNFSGFSLSLSVDSEADADRAFNALAAGGVTKMPLTKTFWSPRFGMLTDKFGVGWMVSVKS